MGGASEQPYIYPSCAPLSERRLAFPYSNFNPKATTQAAYQAIYDQNRPRPKQNGPLLKFDRPVSSYMVVTGDKVNYTPAAYEALQAKKKTKPEGNGPLINFNQHPDSWMVVDSHKPKYKPMPANTKTKVKAIRWVQFVLRVFEEIGALGLLVFMICFKNMPTVFAWIMRIAPAWDVIVSLYGIYHLVRPAIARTPVSSASYHIFALVNDVGILPFYICLCLYSEMTFVEEPGAKSRWRSLFSDSDITTKLLFATFLTSATVAGLHLLSAILDLWLIVLFKAIAKLPPDVNPLEDNLTSRVSRRSKHKYKNSEATLTGSVESFDEKKSGYLSGSTLSVDQASQLGRDVDEADSRKIPFNHTRASNTTTAAARNAEVDRFSGPEFEEVRLYKKPDTEPVFNSPSRAFNQELSKHASSPGPKEMIPWPPSFRERSPRPNSSPGSAQKANVPGSRGTASPALPNAALSTVNIESQQQSSLLNDNWYVVDDDSSDLGAGSRPRSPAIDNPSKNQSVVPLQVSFVPQPLKMNPPTPPLADMEYPDPENEDLRPQTIKRKPLANRVDNGNGDLNRNPTVQSNYTVTSSVYSDEDNESETKSNVRGATPKGKYYGDLAAATRGVLGRTKSKAKATTEVSRIWSSETAKSNGTIGASNMDSTGLSALSCYGYGVVPQKPDRKSRVISRSGVDIVDYAGGDASLGLRGRRDISGKVAEEGRAGSWWSRKG